MNDSEEFIINKPQVIHEVFDEEVVVVNLGNGNYYSLEHAGAAIWGLIEQGTCVGDIVEGLVRQYEGDRGVIQQAVQAFVSELQQEALIVPAPAHESTRVHGQPAPADSGSSPDKRPFEVPRLQTYTDMQELMLLDPIHEVDETGWPRAKPEDADEQR